MPETLTFQRYILVGYGHEVFTKLAPYAFNNFILDSNIFKVTSPSEAIMMRDAGIIEMTLNVILRDVNEDTHNHGTSQRYLTA